MSDSDVRAYGDQIIAALGRLVKLGYWPAVICGKNDKGECIAIPVGEITDQQCQGIVARVMVGNIDPTLLDR